MQLAFNFESLYILCLATHAQYWGKLLYFYAKVIEKFDVFRPLTSCNVGVIMFRCLHMMSLEKDCDDRNVLWITYKRRTWKQVNRNVQGVPQSQAAAKPRHEEEETKDKNQRMQNKQTNAREAHRPAFSSPSKVTTMLKKTGENTRTISKARLNTKVWTLTFYLFTLL